VADTDPAAILARWREAEKAAMDHDGPTVVLEHIRDGAEAEIVHPDDECGISAGGFCTPHAALRLVAALEAVLKLADDWSAKATEIGAQIELEDCEGATAGFKMIGHMNHRDHAAKIRGAITAALAGKEACDGL
jgi:hypothetical protein